MKTTRDPEVIRVLMQRGGALVLVLPDELAVPDEAHEWAVAQVAAKRARKAAEEQR